MTPDTVTYRVPDMTFGTLHTPFGTCEVRSGLVALPDTDAASDYADAAGFVLHDDSEA